ncbi:protein NCBP2AS2 [Gallus gallus]|uniref:NCBP2 antisense 2 (head to head) n=1 Tax=Gallus gallus TaxID=9031 RepID=A0A8V0Z708_CHICK|nr:protein NCBP2AS2 [Gallus gallus]
MVLRRVLLALLSNPHLIEKLAESRPIRAAARLTASAITRGQLGARQAARDLRPGLTRLRDAFLDRLKDGGRPRGWPESPGRGPGSGRGPGRSGRP